jgi:hypothetical protein
MLTKGFFLLLDLSLMFKKEEEVEEERKNKLLGWKLQLEIVFPLLFIRLFYDIIFLLLFVSFLLQFLSLKLYMYVSGFSALILCENYILFPDFVLGIRCF